jgi:hypothetical protein
VPAALQRVPKSLDGPLIAKGASYFAAGIRSPPPKRSTCVLREGEACPWESHGDYGAAPSPLGWQWTDNPSSRVLPRRALPRAPVNMPEVECGARIPARLGIAPERHRRPPHSTPSPPRWRPPTALSGARRGLHFASVAWPVA